MSDDLLNVSMHTAPGGQSQYYVLKRSRKAMTIYEKAYGAALFAILADEFAEELAKDLDEDRAYLLTEYQKVSVTKLREAVDRVIKNVDKSLRAKNIASAIEFVKENNKDSEGFSEE